MTYDSAETSTHDGAPIECYKFIGSFRTYRYTSADREVTVAAETFAPASTKRNAVRAGTQAEDTLSLEIELPFDVDVVRDYAYSESPQSLILEVYRVHRGTDFGTDWILMWKGRVSAFNVTGRIAKVRVPSIFAIALQGDLPSAYYQAPCNHVVYDGRCRADRSSFSTTSTVVDVGTNSFEVTDDGFDDGYLAGGEAVNSRTGERRMILGNVVNTVTISYPFVDNKIGDTITLTAGCDHSFTTCKAKFSNGLNFGGHPYIPSDNPFQGVIG